MSQASWKELLSRPVLLDGGVGTMLEGLGAPLDRPLELLNLTDPALVQEVHKQYIRAGARVITANSFNASGLALGAAGAGDQVRAVNRQAVRLAREVRELQGVHVWVAGSVGPLGEPLKASGFGTLSRDRARRLYQEQIAALVEGGADLLILETFSDLNEALLALQVARSLSGLPVAVTLSFDDDRRTAHGQTAAEAAQALQAAGASAIGANCGTGPRAVLAAVQEMAAAAPDMPLWAKPNAGLPQKRQNRLFFGTTTEYAARFAGEALAAGVRLIGGCCGMTPEHTAAMGAVLGAAAALEQTAAGQEPDPPVPGQPAAGKGAEAPRVAVRPVMAPGAAASTTASTAAVPAEARSGARPSVLRSQLESGTFVTSIEMHPPRSHLTGAFLRAAREYREAGVQLVNLVDSPMARVRMSSLMTCALVQERVGLETIAHLSPRDRTLIGLQADLIGAHALGVRNILCVTGDPHRGNVAPGTVNVYDVDAIGMMRLLAGYNRGVDLKGNDIGQPAHFLIGGALNPNAPDLGLEVERFHQKLAAGMQFCMVQPVFDIAILEQTLERLGRPPVPVIAGIVPIHSYQHALLLHNEIPGIRLTDEALERMRRATADGEAEGLRIARELLDAARQACQGVYIMPSYGRHETALRVLNG